MALSLLLSLLELAGLLSDIGPTWLILQMKKASLNTRCLIHTHTDTHTLLDSSQQAALQPALGFHSLICCSHDTSEPWETIPNHQQDKTSSLMHSGLELEFKIHSQLNSQWPTIVVYTVVSQTADFACRSVH